MIIDDIEIMTIRLKEIKGHDWEKTTGRSHHHFYAKCKICGYRVEYVPANVAGIKNRMFRSIGRPNKYIPDTWVSEKSFMNPSVEKAISNCSAIKMNEALE